MSELKKDFSCMGHELATRYSPSSDEETWARLYANQMTNYFIGDHKRLRRTTVDSTAGGGLKLFLPTFI